MNNSIRQQILDMVSPTFATSRTQGSMKNDSLNKLRSADSLPSMWCYIFSFVLLFCCFAMLCFILFLFLVLLFIFVSIFDINLDNTLTAFPFYFPPHFCLIIFPFPSYLIYSPSSFPCLLLFIRVFLSMSHYVLLILIYHIWQVVFVYLFFFLQCAFGISWFHPPFNQSLNGNFLRYLA